MGPRTGQENKQKKRKTGEGCELGECQEGLRRISEESVSLPTSIWVPDLSVPDPQHWVEPALCCGLFLPPCFSLSQEPTPVRKLQSIAPITLFAGQAGPGHSSPPQAFPEQMPRASFPPAHLLSRTFSVSWAGGGRLRGAGSSQEKLHTLVWDASFFPTQGGHPCVQWTVPACGGVRE